MQVSRINQTEAETDNCAGIWCASWGTEGQAFHRSYPHFFDSRQQDLVP